MEGGRILVVEDEKKIAELVSAYLEKEKFTVTVAETGQRAWMGKIYAGQYARTLMCR
jgi:DNA-binding response OmpR family regulator